MAGSYGIDFVLPALGIQSPSPSKGGPFGFVRLQLHVYRVFGLLSCVRPLL